MIIKRERYLNKLISKKENGLVKTITGIKGSGKSFLLFELYYDYLINHHVNPNQIIEIALDDMSNIEYRNPFKLDQYIRNKIQSTDQMYYIFIDEIQFVETVNNPYLENGAKIGFVDVLLGLMKIKNADIYVTGSNSKMLSSDILTEFRGREDEIRVFPLSYSEFYGAYGDKNKAWEEYSHYGGMPYLFNLNTHEQKSRYLKDLFEKTYIRLVLERNNIGKNKVILEDLLNIISSDIGSLTNPTKLSHTFKSKKNISIGNATINEYLNDLIDAFIIDRAYRYDVKGRKYIDTPLKYYFTDMGLRNARLNFRQMEENHIMENIIFNELKIRGYDVDIGVVEYNYKDQQGKSKRKQLEIDFIINKINKRYYIQSTLNVNEEEKRLQEINSLKRVPDSFKKIVIVKDDIIPWYDDYGILYVGIEQFLLDEQAIDLL